MSHRPLTRNAADRDQVEAAQRIAERRQARYSAALKATLDTPAGRLVLATIIEEAGIYRSVFDHSGSAMYFKEGRRNFGLELQAALIAADETNYDQLERERRQRQRDDEAEAAAAQLAAAHEGDDD